MTQRSTLKAALAVAVLLAWPAVQAQTVGNAEYKDGKARIAADYKTERATCAALSGNGKDVCQEVAKQREKVALATLEHAHTGKAADRNKLLVVKADTAYEVAKERCDDQAGNAKDVCVKEAQALHTKALADAKLGKEIREAQTEAATDKRDADYKVALEKCDALAGDAKSSCVASAKLSFGKS